MSSDLLDKELIEFKKSVIMNVLAVMMTLDGEELHDLLDKQETEKMYTMIYGKEDDDDEESE